MVEQLNLFDLWDEETQKEQPNHLTPRQWQLYRLIKENSLNGRKTTQKEICDLIDGYEWNDSPTTHDHCSAIWTDIKEINLSFELDKLIISKNFEYWIGSKEETQEFIDDLWDALAPRLMRYWRFKRKIDKDGYGKLLSNQLNPIDDESQAREYIESFIKYGN